MTIKPILTVRDLSITFPDNNGGLDALDKISFLIHPREFVCFLGPSGSGKTTFLRVLAGILPPTSGSVNFMYRHQPRIGMVFQSSNLMPWRTVMENIMLPLELEGMGKVKAQNKAREMIKLVGLKGFEDSLPRDLSGGMAQRVAIDAQARRHRGGGPRRGEEEGRHQCAVGQRTVKRTNFFNGHRRVKS